MARSLKFSIAVFTVTTWTFLSFIYSSRPDDGEVNALASLMRIPASLPEELPRLTLKKPHVAEIIEMNVVDLKCWDKSDDVEESTSARWVRITGRDCARSAVDSVAIHNLSNGYTATIFPTSKRALTTDFIPLIAGPNKISIQFVGANGTPVEHQFALNRE